MKTNQNNPNEINLKANVMFVDMNSYFATCEQQVNYHLRGRPVGVCVYTGKYGAVIALSKEAKKLGLKPDRANELIAKCPQLVTLPTNPTLYRNFHVKIIKVLQHFSEDVIPKSIDEAVVNFQGYGLVHKDLVQVAKDIKKKIKEDVGDFLTCSIGIAPNAFLAKLATDLRKPDGLLVISPENIDEILEPLKLIDLPGIAKQMGLRLMMAGINTPLELRYADPVKARRACQSIIGEYWHYRLNFREVDLNHDNEYKSMQAMRQVSKTQREKLETIEDIFRALCLQLERRMVKHKVKARYVGCVFYYEEQYSWGDNFRTNIALQDGIQIMNFLLDRMKLFQDKNDCPPILNTSIVSMGVYISEFQNSEYIQLSLMDNDFRKDNLRKTVYSLKEKFGFEKVIHGSEVQDTPVLKDVIGFGSVKDLI